MFGSLLSTVNNDIFLSLLGLFHHVPVKQKEAKRKERFTSVQSVDITRHAQQTSQDTRKPSTRNTKYNASSVENNMHKCMTFAST